VSVLALIEHDRGAANPVTWESIAAANEIASALGVQVEALIIGGTTGELAADASGYGATVVHVADHDFLADYGPEAWGATVAQIASDTGAEAVVATATDRGNETLAHAAARMGEGMVANVLDAEPGDPWSLTRIRWGGSLLEQSTLVGGTKLMTFAPHRREPERGSADSEMRSFTPDLDVSVTRTMIVSREVESDGMSLPTSPVVVGGGRGVGSEDGFMSLEELAGLLGGVVGCSRVATNSGWRPHSDQVGQTGTKIAPKIYIACGISGAIQHWVGAMASKKVLAINTDPEASMVAKADYSVIGDLHEVVPAITAEIRRRRG